MARLRDLTGQKFGAWSVISRAPNKNNLIYLLIYSHIVHLDNIKFYYYFPA